MPTAEENVQYLYLVLTSGGAPNIDMAAVSKTLSLSTGAVSKRWSRLKQAMEGGKYPGPSAYEFLWLCVKHSVREKALDWHDIAEKCGTTAGAASKRYSRMKQAFERGDAAPITLSKPKNSSNTNPSSPKGTTPTPKRKRAAATTLKKKVVGGQERFKPHDEEDDADEYLDKKPKRVRGGAGDNAAKPRATSKPKGKQPAVKEESNPSAGFLTPSDNSIGYTDGDHLPTPNLSGSGNPTEATTLIKTDPDAPHTHSDRMQDPLDGAPVNDDQEHFYDANEILGEEETFTQENVLANQVGNLGLQEWLEETEI